MHCGIVCLCICLLTFIYLFFYLFTLLLKLLTAPLPVISSHNLSSHPPSPSLLRGLGVLLGILLSWHIKSSRLGISSPTEARQAVQLEEQIPWTDNSFWDSLRSSFQDPHEGQPAYLLHTCRGRPRLSPYIFLVGGSASESPTGPD